MSQTNLNNAKAQKMDEFYTQLSDIENELKRYKEQLKGKVIFCNCDDPFESNFFKYFAQNFNYLKLKKLIATSYNPSPIAGNQLPLLEIEGLKGLTDKEPFAIEINEVHDFNKDGAIGIEDVEQLLRHDKNVSRLLRGNAQYPAGDFRSNECIELLKQSDIVITNPPFSLYRQYIALLMEHDKQFLIVGDDNWITLKETFVLLKEGKMWLGYGRVKEFRQPTGEMKKFGNKCWYTNLDVAKRHEFIPLYKKYSPEEYPTYANFDAIEVNKVERIPQDYSGLMGVPITFLSKYNPEQFEIVGSSSNLSGPIETPDGFVYRYKDRNGYMRQAANERFCLPDGDTWRRIYDRIVIKRKDVK